MAVVDMKTQTPCMIETRSPRLGTVVGTADFAAAGAAGAAVGELIESGTCFVDDTQLVVAVQGTVAVPVAAVEPNAAVEQAPTGSCNPLDHVWMIEQHSARVAAE